MISLSDAETARHGTGTMTTQPFAPGLMNYPKASAARLELSEATYGREQRNCLEDDPAGL